MRKVIHIVESLDRGATEAWLVRMLRFSLKTELALDWTFYCALGKAGERDDEARDLGARVVHSPVPLGETLGFIRALRAELNTGRHDVLHAHHDLVSGIYLLASEGLPIERRLVHVHNAGDSVPTPNGLKRVLLRGTLRQICIARADLIVGVSNHALDTFLDGRARRRDRDVVHYCGIDTAPFENAVADRLAFRRSLRLPDTARIVLFAGRMVPEKEPFFALEVIAEMRQRDPDVAGMFVGSGALSDMISQRASSLGMTGSFRNLGWKTNVPEIMACCDWFIQPGPENPPEGLGLAVVEAQMAGLHLLFSRGIPADALLPGASYSRLPLSAGARAWAAAGIELAQGPRPSRDRAAHELQNSPFQMDRALAELVVLHGGIRAESPKRSKIG